MNNISIQQNKMVKTVKLVELIANDNPNARNT